MTNVSLTIDPKGQKTLQIVGTSEEFLEEHFPDFVTTLMQHLGIPEQSVKIQDPLENVVPKSNLNSQLNPTSTISSKANSQSNPASNLNASFNAKFKYMNIGDLCPSCKVGFMQVERAKNTSTQEYYDRLACGNGCGKTAYISIYPRQNTSTQNSSNKTATQTSSRIS